MCPAYYSPEITNWNSSAYCMFHRYYTRDRDDNPIAPLCASCYYDAEPDVQNTYIDCMRHGIHIGPNEQYVECSICSRVLSEYGPVPVCIICPGYLHRFLRQLEHTGDRSYDNSEPTIIAIYQAAQNKHFFCGSSVKVLWSLPHLHPISLRHMSSQ